MSANTTPPTNPVNQPREDGTTLLDDAIQQTTPPPLWQVIMLNDDFTPMEFVVIVLQHFFHKDLDTATQLMQQIHHQGRAICGVYSKDVAQSKIECVVQFARDNGHPLQCVLESL